MKLDFTFDNAAVGEEREVLLEVRGQNGQNLVTYVCWGGSRIATVRRMLDDGGKGASWLFKPEYEVDVAEGVDMALVSYSSVLIDEEGCHERA